MELDLSREDPFSECQWISSKNFEGYIKNYLPYKARGNHRYINGDQIYYGEWSNGKIHKGVGILTLESSTYIDTVFIGGWINGSMSGYVLILECDKNDPEQIHSIRYNIINNEIIIYSHEFEKPITKNDFSYIFNLFLVNIHSDPAYRAF